SPSLEMVQSAASDGMVSPVSSSTPMRFWYTWRASRRVSTSLVTAGSVVSARDGTPMRNVAELVTVSVVNRAGCGAAENSVNGAIPSDARPASNVRRESCIATLQWHRELLCGRRDLNPYVCKDTGT